MKKATQIFAPIVIGLSAITLAGAPSKTVKQPYQIQAEQMRPEKQITETLMRSDAGQFRIPGQKNPDYSGFFITDNILTLTGKAGTRSFMIDTDLKPSDIEGQWFQHKRGAHTELSGIISRDEENFSTEYVYLDHAHRKYVKSHNVESKQPYKIIDKAIITDDKGHIAFVIKAEDEAILFVNAKGETWLERKFDQQPTLAIPDNYREDKHTNMTSIVN